MLVQWPVKLTLEAHILLLTFFDNNNFQIPLFSKMMPNFLSARHYTNSQNSIISLGYVDFSAKIFLILYPPLEHSTTLTTMIYTKQHELKASHHICLPEINKKIHGEFAQVIVVI